ncbi:MAG: MmgE/PrpD family protein [Flavobacteriales bacterium]|nr:MmgE/PrpD family protein [Flavobacteriales bacterium]
MKEHKIRVYKSEEELPKENQLAYKLARLAIDDAPISTDVIDMVINRIIDNASVAIASFARNPVSNARDQATAHPRENGATVFGLPNKEKFHAEWAAWANGTAVRELDYHDTFLAADYAHPGDTIPPILATAQQLNKNGSDLIKAIVSAYEIHVSLVKAICLHEHKIDHIAHLCPAQTGGVASLLKLDVDTVFQSIQQALHLSISTRQSRKGEISSWKAYVPAHGGKQAIEAVDRAMRGEKSPSPIYEGEDSVIAWILGGKDANYSIYLPTDGEEKRSILETYTKEHSAEYQAQALIDLAFKMKDKISDSNQIKSILIETSHHTHNVIGTGANDPQKFNPNASRETLDHSIMYIFSVALEDGFWHHEKSYAPERANQESTVKLWSKVSTIEDKRWTELYHHEDPAKRSFGGKVIIELENGEKVIDELERANAHPAGAKPFVRANYIQKFDSLTSGIIEQTERDRFIGLVENLENLSADEIQQLNVQVKPEILSSVKPKKGIF